MPEALGAVILDMDGVIRRWRPGPTHAVDQAYGLTAGTIDSIALTVPESYLGVLGVCSFADWLDAIARELSTHIGVDAREAVHRWASYRGDIDRHTMAIVEQLRTRVPVHVDGRRGRVSCPDGCSACYEFLHEIKSAVITRTRRDPRRLAWQLGSGTVA